MIEYDFLIAKDVDSALEYLHKYESIKVLAGGTDLLVDIHKESSRLEKFDYILDISNIKALQFIDETEDSVELGPLCTHTMLINSNIINKHFPFLVTAAKSIGSTQIRNRGTVGGNISNASPAADLIPPLMALNSEIELSSVRGRRLVKLENYIVGPYKTVKNNDELVTKIIIPKVDGNYRFSFQKIGRRRALNIARLNLAIVAKINEQNSEIEDIRIVPGSATPFPVRFKNIEGEILNQKVNQLNLEELAKKIGDEMVKITGERWSTPYKKPALGAIFKKAIIEVTNSNRKF
ncbi:MULTISPECIES: xanthine dehydrogenase family protein subunit M [Petrotoga]|uniref:Carbon-monoxide dehydrogenase medium subunit/xanthine dehydrogenase FAD-binding subunit n=2 Tax=Petrotoga sibirica TaxID=156202 RepID=A0A4R8EWU2_9BACT|nr:MULTISPECIES: xanthine dehydrogenase family protein subunit M [Petrotoga]POZ88078.1 molybdopterin dehydrogenase [Petrotoga sibirica DSM 13575]POZ90169.1 molybdopterin dehydrogenase [Petrotoga sp. SL27]TDX17180.1 carbon-monoxide dehydrogenase medium subunit/xanthine dehydrogenase FAD-binding subunit [Petrotoga sibirica]